MKKTVISMFDGLSGTQADGLPPIAKRDLIMQSQQLSVMPRPFSDSTHLLWQGFWPEKAQWGVIKVCLPEQLADSPFWQGMHGIFGLALPEEMAHYTAVYAQVAAWTPLQVPVLWEAGSAQAGYGGWLWAQKVEGELKTPPSSDTDALERLAEHLNALQAQQSDRFGPLFEAVYPAEQWGNRVLATLVALAARADVDLQPYADEMAVFRGFYAGRAEADWRFVPIMPDLRWDQFLFRQNKLAVLVDLDAVVWGVPELEWVLLEYLLDASGAQRFAQHYARTAEMHILSAVRTVYRLLLFFMNVLGRTDLSDWMNHPPHFGRGL